MANQSLVQELRKETIEGKLKRVNDCSSGHYRVIWRNSSLNIRNVIMLRLANLPIASNQLQ